MKFFKILPFFLLSLFSLQAAEIIFFDELMKIADFSKFFELYAMEEFLKLFLAT